MTLEGKPLFTVSPVDVALSSCGRLKHVTVTRQRGGAQYSTDEPHVIFPGNVVSSRQPSFPRKLHVHLAGTGCSPSRVNVAFNFLQTTHDAGWPTVGLSYMWANYADAEKNKIFEDMGSVSCQSLLEAYHSDVCYGGSSSPITDVPMSGSIVGSLAGLIFHLAATRPKTERWHEFLTEAASSEINHYSIDFLCKAINWGEVVLSGHSQGAGHAAYMAQRLPLHRVALFSGPQESCLVDSSMGEAHWLSKPYACKEICAMMHAHEEGSEVLIPACWSFMPQMQHFDQGKVYVVVLRDVSDAMDARQFRTNGSASPSRLVITHILPNPGIEIARPNHNSLTLDAKTPILLATSSVVEDGMTGSDAIARSLCVYSAYVWPYMILGPTVEI